MSLLESRARAQPDKTFLVFEGGRTSYAQVLAGARAAARALAARGVRAGDRVGVISANHPATVFTFFALGHLGAIMVSVNPDYGVEEARYVFTHAGVCGVVAAPATLEKARAACAALAPAPWFALNQPGAGAPPLVGDAGADADALPPGGAAPAATCILVYTSGTTGFPKGVMHSQKTVVLAGEGFVQRMFLQPDERILCVLPMFHINAVFYSLTGALVAGATLILEPRFSAARFWEVAEATGATEVNTIAAAAGILMRRPRSEYRPGHKLTKMFGAPFDAEVYRVFGEEFHLPHVIEGFGMSEIPGAMNNPFDGERRVGSMGLPSTHPDPAVRLTELKVIDDDGNTVGPRTIGELAVRTPTIMQGYYNDPEQTRAAFRDGWFLTGDLAWVDEDGYYWFVARKKDIIRKRGENVSGAELDRVIGNHPAVLEAAAIPVPADLGEDEILVAVVLREGMRADAAEIAAWCRARLAPIKVPRYVVFVDALPHTPTHRVEKFRMRQDKTLRERAVDLAAPG
ncbi:MAG: AMP-binding protein [Burkholderiales bacterium]|nr:AMP-binding protein [Burkholderiales bacterium]